MPISLRLSKKLKSVLRWLRRHYPVKRPVRVRIVPPSKAGDWDGLCTYDKKSVYIQLRAGLTDGEAAETLLEEWSHALRSECPLQIEDEHDQLFWAIYSKLQMHYRDE
tara:strand:+ start:184 stop:507 length:324 start_codon:yes stop_codon:yes gene_type:complete